MTAGLLPAQDELDRLLVGDHRDPHSVLGPHPAGTGTVVRTVRPGASAVSVLVAGNRYPMTEVTLGLFTGFVPIRLDEYRFEVHRESGVDIVDDPYRWPPTVSEREIVEAFGSHGGRLWDVLGAHRRGSGVSFTVWAPNARGVRVAGDFDGWSGRGTPMRLLARGVWEIFVPGVRAGCRYKFRILGADGVWHEHADPMAFATELPPATASVVSTHDFLWTDSTWLARRRATDAATGPMSIYEVHLGSWRPGLSYRDLAGELGAYVLRLGFTHVELLPVTEHPFGGSWGYQVTSYFAPTSRYGTPDDFRYLIDHLHGLGIGVILDWVPAHFPRDAWALARFDGTPLYEHADPRRGEHPDWGTFIFDLARKEVRAFLIASALYWLSEFHLDGLRVDAVASMLYLDYSRAAGEWLPNPSGGRENLDAVEFLRELTTLVRRHCPGTLLFAEESTAWPGVTSSAGLGFGYKWNMGWMHDTLTYLSHDPVHRAHHHDLLTLPARSAWSERYLLPLSHDEVVHGKGSLWQRMPGDDPRKAAGLRALLAYMWAFPGKQLLFMGGEFGQVTEWSADSSLDWSLLSSPHHRGVQRLVAALNTHYRRTPALYTKDHDPTGFTWLHATDAEHNVLAFLRHSTDGSVLACVVNFAGIPHNHYRLGLPAPGRWTVTLNTDQLAYGGSSNGKPSILATGTPAHGQSASAVVELPALTTLWLTQEGP